jgi:two-component system, OmpR family, sensor histidine kinase KdpD
MTQGRLRIYLGVSPGAGTTHALLDEAARRARRGRHVVVGLLDEDPRPALSGPADGDPAPERVLPPGTWDLDAVLRAAPDVVLFDDLEAPLEGDPGRQRWHAAQQIVDAGVDVIAGTDVTAVASLADEVERCTGRAPAHTVPDAFLAAAAQVQLVDMAPEALRRRLAHGGILSADEMDAALARQFSVPSLTALRELALSLVLRLVREADGGGERVVVAVSGGRRSEAVLRRAVRAASDSPGAAILAVEVLGTDRLAGLSRPDSERVRALSASLGVEYRQVVGTNVPAALLAVAEAENARRIVVGAANGGRRDVAAALVRAGSGVEIDVVPGADPTTARVAPAASELTRTRQLAGAATALALPVATTLLGQAGGAWVGLPATTMLFLLAVVVTSMVGGLLPALTSALVSSALLNYFFIPPLRSWAIAEPHNALALAIFALVGVLVSTVVQQASGQTKRAAQASAESKTLAALADSALHGRDALPEMLERARASFGMRSATLLARSDAAGADPSWTVLHAVGPDAPTLPGDADAAVPAGPGLVLALSGRTLAASDQTVLRAFATQTQNLLERDQLARSAALAARLEATEKLRDALLGAVGHDLRKPLASTRAALDSLRGDVDWTPVQRQELLDTAGDSLDRLTRIVEDLLDLTRLQTGALRVARDQVWLDDVIPPALDELGPAASAVTLTAPDDLPPALADAALVKRIVSNLVGNALDHGAATDHDNPVPPTVAASSFGDRVEVRVIDRGHGMSAADRQAAFLPFQRVGDGGPRSGLGLGLALSRGLAEAMGGSVDAEDTPGGGLTMVLTLPAASDNSSEEAAPGHRERGEERL